jgi:hypothetical protein
MLSERGVKTSVEGLRLFSPGLWRPFRPEPLTTRFQKLLPLPFKSENCDGILAIAWIVNSEVILLRQGRYLSQYSLQIGNRLIDQNQDVKC